MREITGQLERLTHVEASTFRIKLCGRRAVTASLALDVATRRQNLL